MDMLELLQLTPSIALNYRTHLRGRLGQLGAVEDSLIFRSSSNLQVTESK